MKEARKTYSGKGSGGWVADAEEIERLTTGMIGPDRTRFLKERELSGGRSRHASGRMRTMIGWLRRKCTETGVAMEAVRISFSAAESLARLELLDPMTTALITADMLTGRLPGKTASEALSRAKAEHPPCRKKYAVIHFEAERIEEAMGGAGGLDGPRIGAALLDMCLGKAGPGTSARALLETAGIRQRSGKSLP